MRRDEASNNKSQIPNNVKIQIFNDQNKYVHFLAENEILISGLGFRI